MGTTCFSYSWRRQLKTELDGAKWPVAYAQLAATQQGESSSAAEAMFYRPAALPVTQHPTNSVKAPKCCNLNNLPKSLQ